MRRNVIDTYPRETVDFIPLVDVTINGQIIDSASDLEVSIVGEVIRPASWVPAVTVDSTMGFILNGPGLGRGVFAVYVRPTAGSIRPVVLVGHIRLK